MKKILITGGRGFLGSAISEVFKDQIVVTLGKQSLNDIVIDLSTSIPNINEHLNTVIHCAGKAHSVPKTIEENQVFFDVNLKGTNNLLLALENAPDLPKSFVLISTVAVYGCDKGNLITELHPLNGKDPYALSKIQAEELVQNWCKINNVICTILRLPLLVGSNPPGNLGAMIKGIKKGYYFNINHGKAKKSMVLASDVAKVIPTAAKIGGIFNLTDGHHPTFNELSLKIGCQIGKSKLPNLPIWIATMLAKIGDIIGDKSPINTKKLDKIVSNLTFDDSKARKELNWEPTLVLIGFKIE